MMSILAVPSTQPVLNSPPSPSASVSQGVSQTDDNKTTLQRRQEDEKKLQKNPNTTEISDEAKKLLESLKKRDAEVKAHEQAHISAGGAFVKGGAGFQYEKGPDGKQYAVAGEVSIDASEVPGDPKETITKAETIGRAALAPANPSAQDRRVAAQAGAMKNKAEAELTKLKTEGRSSPRQASAQSPLATEYTPQGKPKRTETLQDNTYSGTSSSMMVIA